MALEIGNKTALVTGGGSGIGLALTRKLLAGGCNVVVADLQLVSDARAVVSAAGSDRSTSPRAVYVQTDVTDWKQLHAAFETAMTEFGRLDIVVPGAGIFEPPWSSFWEYNGASRDSDETGSFKIFDINVSHPIRATQLAIDYFTRQKLSGGVVCHIASIASQMTLLPIPLYCASKHAIAAFVRSLAPLEPAMNIRVNAVAPGIVKTPLWTQERLGWVDDSKDAWVTTEQVADAMLEMMTKPEYVGGTVLEIGAEKNRLVDGLNDPGPQGAGTTVENIAQGFNDVFATVEKNFGQGARGSRV